MTDRILIDRLAVYAHHGVLSEEATLGQRFFITIECRLDLRGPGRSDNFRDTVCYRSLAETAHEIATVRRFHLIEGLAEAVAAAVLGRFPSVRVVKVRVDKPEAPVPFVFGGVAIEIERGRND